MTPDVYRAVIDEAHKRNLRVAAHIFYLDDAKDLLKAGVDMIAHSVRDKDLDDETIALMKARNVPYCPTLTREVSTFVYESTPRFFDDPFFLKEADRGRHGAAAGAGASEGDGLVRDGAALQGRARHREAQSEEGVGRRRARSRWAPTPAQFPERFQGFFEHLEMAMMVESGMTPAQVLRASTVDAARAIGRQDIGALAAGRWADFVVLDKDPLADVANTRTISSVWIAGAEIKRIGRAFTTRFIFKASCETRLQAGALARQTRQRNLSNGWTAEAGNSRTIRTTRMLTRSDPAAFEARARESASQRLDALRGRAVCE